MWYKIEELDNIYILPLIEGIMVDYTTKKKTNIPQDNVEADIYLF